MKKLLIVIFCAAFVCCACSFGKSTSDYVDDLIETEKRLDKEVVKNYCNFSSRSLVNDTVKGVLSVNVADFDNDGEDETIISRVVDDDIVITLYKLEDKKLIEKDSIVVLENYLSTGSIVRIDGFTKKIKDEENLYFEATANNSFFADGIDWSFVKVGVVNNKLTLNYRKTIAGSYFDDHEIDILLTDINNSGLDAQELVLSEGKYLVDQDDKANKMFRVERRVYDGFNPEQYEKEKENVNYGETSFIDYTK
jgi:hypothetical protein